MRLITKMIERLSKLKAASKKLRSSSLESRNKVLQILSVKLQNEKSKILEANAADCAAIQYENPAFHDRLVLNDKRIEGLHESLALIASMPDPINEVIETRTLSNGLRTSRIRAPLGVLFVIFESRPNVVIEAFSLALKSGNALVLRGGKESVKTCAALYSLIIGSLAQVGQETGLSADVFWGITNPDRALVKELLSLDKFIDVVIPRGGDKLMEFVTQNSRIPIIKNDRGLCHVYIHEDADLQMARALVENSKTQRPGVCNAMETLLVHEKIAALFLPMLIPLPVEFFCCEKSLKIMQSACCKTAVAAVAENFNTEYLDLKMNVRIVQNLEEALAHINTYGSKHSEAIVTDSARSAKIFQRDVDAGVVYWNASTRFTDGFALGLGGEIGISTQKLHVRGPVGLKELTSPRWIIEGSGQIRQS